MISTIKQILLVSCVGLCAGGAFVGCATQQKMVQTNYQTAQWDTKAVVKNLKNGGINSMNIQIWAIRNDRARFEITALFGFQVASLVMSPREISFIYYPHKEFYYGRNSERALRSLIDLPLHPMNLSYVAFDEPIRGQGWVCKAGIDRLVESCQHAGRGLTVKWTNRENGTKRIVITSPEIEMTWYFSAPQTSVQFKSGLFTLSQPEGFKAIQLH